MNFLCSLEEIYIKYFMSAVFYRKCFQAKFVVFILHYNVLIEAKIHEKY